MLLFFLFQGCHRPDKKKIIHAWEQSGTPVNLVIEYPRNGTLFPPEITAPTVIWKESIEKSTLWLILVEFCNGEKQIMEFTEETNWQPDPEQWKRIKANSTDTLVKITILGVRPKYPGKILSAASINIQTSTDEVGAPIFFRDVPLPFIYAVENLDEIKWRFGNIDRSEPPPVVLENLPICGNCHSFTSDGNTLAMDIDYANDKGSYVITDLEKHMPITKDKIITWSDYRREDGENTFGLLSQISPDGKKILFAREKYHRNIEAEKSNRVVLPASVAAEFIEGRREFKYDLYSVPFNEGRGGKPEPVPGASNNGKSNYFPKYSPDGKWIVFTQADNFMLLQPDSKLFIIPAEGGESREMICNNSKMNSWHSWSPNGKWLVFSSKERGAYTQLFLTHIDKNGIDTPPVWLENMLPPERAANIPEFVNTEADRITGIEDEFSGTGNYSLRMGYMKIEAEDFSGAIPLLNIAIQKDPDEPLGYLYRGQARREIGDLEEALKDFKKVIEINPDHVFVYIDRGITYANLKKYDKAIADFNAALKMDPLNDIALCNKGYVYLEQGQYQAAITEFNKALKINPNSPKALSNKAIAQQKIFELSDSKIDEKATTGFEFFNEGVKYAERKNYRKAIELFSKAIDINPEYTKAYHNRAVAYFILEELEKAWIDLRKVKELGGQIHPGLLEEYNKANKEKL